jgi:hypothetical protein
MERVYKGQPISRNGYRADVGTRELEEPHPQGSHGAQAHHFWCIREDMIGIEMSDPVGKCYGNDHQHALNAYGDAFHAWAQLQVPGHLFAAGHESRG